MSEQSFTILIVDDESRILSALSRMLRPNGYKVLTSMKPEEVLELLERERVDVLLSDIDMPKVSGTALMAQVRAKFPEVVRILMTGRGSMESVLRAINEGEVYRYLTKPFEETTLLQVLQEAVSRLKELRRASAAALIVARRDELTAALEREFPGICHIEREKGVYVISAALINDLVELINHPKLRELLARRL